MPRLPDHVIAIRLLTNFINSTDWEKHTDECNRFSVWLCHKTKVLSLCHSSLSLVVDDLINLIAFEVAKKIEAYAKDNSSAAKKEIFVWAAVYLGLLNDRDFFLQDSQFGRNINDIFTNTQIEADDLLYSSHRSIEVLKDGSF